MGEQSADKGLDLSPVGDTYKKKDLASAQDRIEMCELAVGHGQAEESAFIMVDTWEPLQVWHICRGISVVGTNGLLSRNTNPR